MVIVAHYNEVKLVLTACAAGADRQPGLRALLDRLRKSAKAYMDGVVNEQHTSVAENQDASVLRYNLLGSMAELDKRGYRFPDLPLRDMSECLVSAMES